MGSSDLTYSEQNVTSADSASIDRSAPLQVRVRAVVESLRDALIPVIVAGAGAGGRPATLARALGIDRTLAARIVRAVHSPQITDVVHELPSPEGLRIFLTAATRLGLAEGVRDRAALSIRRFEEFLDEIPGGRGGLDAAAAEWSTATRERTENAAKQAIFRSMSSLLGYSAESSLATVILQPSSENEGFVDAAYVLAKHNIVRLRPEGAITAFGFAGGRTEGQGSSSTLAGVATDDLTQYLLRGHCSKPLPSLVAVRGVSSLLAVLPEGTPEVNEPVTIASAQLVRRSGVRPTSPGMAANWESHSPRMPSKRLQLDVLVREDTYAMPPRVTTSLMSIAPPTLVGGADSINPDHVSLSMPVSMLARGLPDLASTITPSYEAMIEEVFEGLGWNRSRFVGYRCSLRYPVPLVALAFWFDAPTAGSDHGQALSLEARS